MAIAIGLGGRWIFEKIEEERRARHALPAFSQMTDDAFQAEVARGFRQPDVGVPPATLKSIQRFFEEASRHRDKESFSPEVLELIDGPRSLKEIERSANCVRLGRDDRINLEVMPFADNPLAQSGLPPRIVHVELRENRREAVIWGYSANGVPSRWWLSRSREGWKLFDWEDSETGRRETEELAIEQTLVHRREFAWDFFVELANASDAVSSSPYDAEALARLEAIDVGELDERVFDDGVMRVAFAHYYRHDYQRCLEYCDLVKRPGIRPDVERLRCFCLEQLERWEEAIQSAERYERLLGPTPAVLLVQARVLNRLSRRAEAEQVWRRLLAATPADVEALTGWAESLPDERQQELVEHLGGLPDFQRPAQELVERLCAAEHDVGARTVADWLAKAAPDTRESLEATADLKNFDEDFAGAAALYLAAHAKAASDDERSNLLYAYLAAMAAAGRQVEAHAQAPDKRAVLESFWWDFRDDGAYELTREKLRAIVAAHKSNHPDDPLAAEIEASLLSDEGRYAEAEKLLVTALANMRQQPDADREDTLRSSLVDALLGQGKWKEALAQRAQSDDLPAMIEQLIMVGLLREARELIEHLQQQMAGDPSLPLCRALLLQAERKYAEAFSALPAPMLVEQSGGSPDWRSRNLVSELVAQDESLLDRFAARNPDSDHWEMLAGKLRLRDRWVTLESVVEQWRARHPSEPEALYWTGVVKSHAKDHAAVAALLGQPLADGSASEIPVYRRSQLHLLLVDSLLALGQFEEARRHGQHVLKQERDSEPLLQVLLARGDAAAMEKLASESNASSSWLPYHQPRFRALLTDDRFRQLRQAHPPTLEYSYLEGSVTLLFADREPPSPAVATERIAAALPGASFKTLALAGMSPSIQTIEALHGGERWLIHIGSEPYAQSQEELPQNITSRPLRDAVSAHRTWVQIARENSPSDSAVPAAALAAAMRPPPGTAVSFANRLALWDDALAKRLAASPEDVDDVGEAHYLVSDSDDAKSIGGKAWREFLQSYRQRADDSQPFRVQIEVTLGQARERLWLSVLRPAEEGPRSQGLIAAAETDSLLFPTLKAGEPREIYRYRVLAVDPAAK